MSITAIAAKLGFSQPSVFSKFFRTLTKSQPWEWRIEKKKAGLKPEENLSLLRVISRQYMLKHTPSVQFPPQSSLL